MKRERDGFGLALVFFLMIAAAVCGAESDVAKAILELAGGRTAFCVVLGCRDGRLCAELGREGDMLVHGLAFWGGAVEKARKYLQEEKMYGRVSVAMASGRHLPYADNLVNLLVIDDVPKALKAGLLLKEVARVTCPKGVVLLAGLSEKKLNSELAKAGVTGLETVKQDGGWIKITKSWSRGMGEWTHGKPAAGRVVSEDTLVGPPGRIRWMSRPKWYFAGQQVPLVSANGRLFYGGSMPPFEGIRGPADPLLIARDGFNGLLLWTRPFPALGEYKGRKGPRLTVLAAGDRVFAVLKPNEPLTAMDARTGATLTTFKEVGAPQRVVCHKGVLVLKGGTGLYAFDSSSGKQLWTRKDSARSICAGEGKLFFHVGGSLLCVDVATGKDLWRSENPGGSLRFYKKGVLVCASGNSGRGISAKDGTTLWTSRGPWGSAVCYHELCWSYTRRKGPVKGSGEYVGLDPLDGKEKKRVVHLNRGTVGGRCFPAVSSAHYVFWTDFHCLDLTGGVSRNTTNMARPACRTGGMVANGLFYPFPQLCMCYPALRGMMGLAPADPADAKEPHPEQAHPLEKGPAYGRKSSSVPTGAEDWPMHRYDPRRSCGAGTKVPADCRLLWDVNLGGKLSGPVISGGKVFLALVDRHQIVALDEKSKKQLWSYTAEGRVDSPPTIHEGLCLFGSTSGWVTCLDAANGGLVWRFRAAPAERRIMAYGQLESAWPVHGSVLVKDGVAFLAAGRHSDADGGMYVFALEPRTGKVIWRKRHYTRGWAFKLDPETFKFVWIDPRRLEGASMKPTPQGWAVSFGYKGLDKCFFTEGGAYRVDPETGIIHWVTDDELEKNPRKAKWSTWDTKNFADVVSSGTIRLRDMLLNGLLVAADEVFRLRNWSFAFKDGTDRYGGTFRGLKSLRAGPSLLENVSVWRCYPWMSYKQYYGDGRPLAYDDGDFVYGVRHHLTGQSRYTVLGKGTLVYAWPKADQPKTPDNPRRKKKRLWEQTMPLQVQSMIVADQVLFLAAVTDEVDPNDYWAALKGKKGGMLWAVSKTDGKILHKQNLDSMPAFDGMAAANGRLYVSMTDGRLLCFGKE